MFDSDHINGPKSVRMYHDDKNKKNVNNEVHYYHKMATNTIREMSCESNSVEPSPKSQASPPGVSPSNLSPNSYLPFSS